MIYERDPIDNQQGSNINAIVMALAISDRCVIWLSSISNIRCSRYIELWPDHDTDCCWVQGKEMQVSSKHLQKNSK